MQNADQGAALGLDGLVEALCQAARLPERQDTGPLVLSVDHCFLVKGQGTVLTGTILQGSVAVNDVSAHSSNFFVSIAINVHTFLCTVVCI